MLLRRFTAHVKAQNWFAVGLDLIVVVVGIYIGLQADAWMSARQDRALEKEYLQRLLADVQESLEEQRVSLDVFDESIVAIDYLSQVLRSGQLENADSEKLTESFNSVLWVAPPVTNMGTIEELQSTGNIGLIRDVEVRVAIGQFQRSYAGAEFSTSQNVEFMAAAAPPLMPWSYMAPRVPGEHRSLPEAQDASYGVIYRLDVERMMADPDAANVVSWISGWSKYHGSVLAQHHQDTKAFGELLRAQNRIPGMKPQGIGNSIRMFADC